MWIAHRHLMRLEEPDQYQICGDVLSVKHIIICCRKYADIKIKLNIPGHLHEARTPDQDCTNKIIQLLKILNLYNLI